MTNLEYIDSAGIHTVFELRAQLKNRGQEMRLVVPAQATIANTLRIVDIPRLVGVSKAPRGRSTASWRPCHIFPSSTTSLKP